MAVPYSVRSDLLSASAIEPTGKLRIDEPRDVRRLRLRLTGATCRVRISMEWDRPSMATSSRSATRRGSSPAPRIRTVRAVSCSRSHSSKAMRRRFVAEAQAAIRNVSGSRAQAERLTRHVNAILDKKPTVSLPSAREVLRTKVGDCNEHTALYVAMARAARHPCQDCRRPRVGARRLLLPRLAGGVPGGRTRARHVAAGRSDAQPVSGRRARTSASRGAVSTSRRRSCRSSATSRSKSSISKRRPTPHLSSWAAAPTTRVR